MYKYSSCLIKFHPIRLVAISLIVFSLILSPGHTLSLLGIQNANANQTNKTISLDTLPPYVSGDELKVSIPHPQLLTKTAWAAVYKIGATHGNYLSWKRIKRASTVTLHAPSPGGDYEIRLFSAGPATSRIDTSEPFNVLDLHVLGSHHSTDGKIRVKVGPGGSTAWIGLYQINTGNNHQDRQWKFIKNSRELRFDAPNKTGHYEFRLFANSSSASLQYTSPSIYVSKVIPTAPTMISPSAGARLTRSQEFQWQTTDGRITDYKIRAGSTELSADFYDSGLLTASTTKHTVNNLPADGNTVYVTLEYKISDGQWRSDKYQFLTTIENRSLFMSDAYSSIDLSQYNMTQNVWTISSSGLMDHGSLKELEVLMATEEQIRASLESYLQKNPSLSRHTTDIVILDIENWIHPKDLADKYLYLAERYRISGETPHPSITFRNAVNALKLRIKVARSIFPNAKLGLYGTVISNSTGWLQQPHHIRRMNGYQAAISEKLYDDLDYLVPVVYMRFSPSEGHYATLEEYTKGTIIESRKLNKSNGDKIPLLPTLTFVKVNGEKEFAETSGLKTQLETLSVLGERKILFYGGGGPDGTWNYPVTSLAINSASETIVTWTPRTIKHCIERTLGELFNLANPPTSAKPKSCRDFPLPE